MTGAPRINLAAGRAKVRPPRHVLTRRSGRTTGVRPRDDGGGSIPLPIVAVAVAFVAVIGVAAGLAIRRRRQA